MSRAHCTLHTRLELQKLGASGELLELAESIAKSASQLHAPRVLARASLRLALLLTPVPAAGCVHSDDFGACRASRRAEEDICSGLVTASSNAPEIVAAPIGSGAYSSVHPHCIRGHPVAIKTFRPQHSVHRDMLREVYMLRAVAPGAPASVMCLLDCHMSVSDGMTAACLVMPLYQCTLGTAIRRHASKVIASNVARDLAEALRHCHGKGVMHRDLKPSNVLMDESFNCILTDFNMARRFDGARAYTMNVVSLWYRAPELLQTEPVNYDSAIDIWSLGCMIAEVLCRAPLLPVDSALEMRGAQACFLGEKKCNGCIGCAGCRARVAIMSIYAFEEMHYIVPMLRANPKRRPTANKVLEAVNSFIRISKATMDRKMGAKEATKGIVSTEAAETQVSSAEDQGEVAINAVGGRTPEAMAMQVSPMAQVCAAAGRSENKEARDEVVGTAQKKAVGTSMEIVDAEAVTNLRRRGKCSCSVL